MTDTNNKPNTIYFLNQERELCKICLSPIGFCKHTIENEFKCNCLELEHKIENLWLLTRILAIERTENKKKDFYYSKRIKELETRNLFLEEQFRDFKVFKKHFEEFIK